MVKQLFLAGLGLLSLWSGAAGNDDAPPNSSSHLLQPSHITRTLNVLGLDVQPSEVARHLNALPDSSTESDKEPPESRASAKSEMIQDVERRLWMNAASPSSPYGPQSVRARKKRFLYPKYVHFKHLFLHDLDQLQLTYPITCTTNWNSGRILDQLRLPELYTFKGVTIEQLLSYLLEETSRPRPIFPEHLDNIRITYNLLILKAALEGGVLYEIRPNDSGGPRVTCVANANCQAPINLAYLQNLGSVDTHRRFIFTHPSHANYAQITRYFQQQHGVVISAGPSLPVPAGNAMAGNIW
ncbi:hypothetical protein H4R34_000899 [Dimargaris verticillata]|uniref:Uncharacterized protein n=1 Tax=Dimargaris verticillata TaxID=2761393 RepID=A0A9W8B5D8_9FUNG|nr:hypothetical protein H4R34_000899 [Dimargaris verticillata]